MVMGLEQLREKTYKCRLDGTKNWKEVLAPSPAKAAVRFAQWNFCEDEDVISVKGVGKFGIYTDTIYFAERV